ncbi:hypothetical protein [Ignatzschineria indica]|uniref:hypothetical protein n=1 Tax=Ignatzschineria indica TaxID=472583 RepID=UPI001300B68A|nr:hypothetical protein [Ignatzschineria indica]
MKQKQQGLNAAGSYYRVLPEITRRQDGNFITRKIDYFKDTISDIISDIINV